jgi:hypothetical protein
VDPLSLTRADGMARSDLRPSGAAGPVGDDLVGASRAVAQRHCCRGHGGLYDGFVARGIGIVGSMLGTAR